MSFETASIGQSPIATNTAAFDLAMAEAVPGPYEFLMSSGALRTSKVLAEEPVLGRQNPIIFYIDLSVRLTKKNVTNTHRRQQLIKDP